MKSNICFWLTSLILFCAGSADSMGCGPISYHPYGYKMYRVYDAEADIQPDQIMENCRLWQELTSSEIPLSDIRQVVYKYTLDQMNSLMSVNSSNAFASWIKNNKDTEVYDFLVLAKKCEKTRGEMLDPWYFPSKNDGSHLSLSEIELAARGYDGKRLKDRYVLQAIRAMVSAQKYQEIVDYWQETEASIPDGLIKDMIQDYVLGAYARVNKIDEALEYFTAEGDLNSILFCLREKGEINDLASELECINRYAPDSPQIPKILQDIIGSMEPEGHWDYSYEYRRDSSLVIENRHYYYSSDENQHRFDEIYPLVMKMTETPSSDKALWHYTAAFLADLDARSDEAWKHIQEASKYPASDYLKGSIRIMKMYLDAKVSPYDKDYEERLSQDLIWIDRMITGNITAEVCNIMQGWESYKMRNNISFYYWNDMMRRILLAEICPRMLDRGMPVRALQLANMADHRLLMLFDIVDDKPMSMHRSGSCRNYYDYRNDFFEMMQYTDPQNLGAYIRNLESSTNDFDLFLKNRGYVDYDYLYDVLGTVYIRERDYANAVKYLSLVSEGYQNRLNASPFMNRNPFSLERSSIKPAPQYKLNFAKEMLRLEKSIESATNNNIKGLDMIKYATGVRNAYSYCWPLTRYSDYYYLYDDDQIPAQILKDIENRLQEALSIIDNPEIAALAHIQLCQWKTAVEKYPNAYASQFAKSSCDNLCNYSFSHVVRRKY